MNESFSETDSENKDIERKKGIWKDRKKDSENELLVTCWCPLITSISAIRALPSLGLFWKFP